MKPRLFLCLATTASSALGTVVVAQEQPAATPPPAQLRIVETGCMSAFATSPRGDFITLIAPNDPAHGLQLLMPVALRPALKNATVVQVMVEFGTTTEVTGLCGESVPLS